MSGLLDKRLIFVTGKGGTGKSTVAAALGLLAAGAGRRAIVAEVGGQDDVRRCLDGARSDGAEEEVEVAPGLHTVSIDPERALAQYLQDQLPLRLLSDTLSHSRSFQYLAAATPGLRELLAVGKVWDLVQPRRRAGDGAGYDVAIVDAPASGHAVGYLRAPRTFAEIARVGPIARQAGIIDRMLRDGEATGVVAVAQPAEMPVNETIALGAALAGFRSGAPALDLVVVNRVLRRRFGPRQELRLRAALDGAPSQPAQRALRAALTARARGELQREQLERLRGAALGATAELPFVLDPDWGADSVRKLARRLERSL